MSSLHINYGQTTLGLKYDEWALLYGLVQTAVNRLDQLPIVYPKAYRKNKTLYEKLNWTN